MLACIWAKTSSTGCHRKDAADELKQRARVYVIAFMRVTYAYRAHASVRISSAEQQNTHMAGGLELHLCA
jgi:hypothetical protein